MVWEDSRTVDSEDEVNPLVVGVGGDYTVFSPLVFWYG